MTADQEKAEHYCNAMVKRWAKHYLTICMAYDCKCGARTYFAMDRYPMSYKIGFQCEGCNKFDYRKIVQPFVYYAKIYGEIEKPEDLVFADSNDKQYELLKHHIGFENQHKYGSAPI